MKIENYTDLKALAILNDIKLYSELPKMLGYKSCWGLKLAMKNPKKRDRIIEKATTLFSK